MELNGGQKRFSVRHVHENPAFVDDSSSYRPMANNTLENRDNYHVSLRHLTKEALPRIDQYRNSCSVQYANRPTLEELHEGFAAKSVPEVEIPELPGTTPGGHVHVKFGWIEGVLILNIMSLWGPMLFLRTSWLVGQGGLIEAIVLILFATLITTITALSTSAIATNGEVKGGGTFYMLSRSLGPQYGGAIGLIFAFANMVGVAMNIVGFCEGLQNLMRNFDVKIVDNGVNDIRIVGVAAAIFCMIVCLVGMEWEQKAQIVFLVILLVAIMDVFVGSFIPADLQNKANGITGWSVETGRQNVLPDYRGETFITLFAVYFPSATGILSGANISGELKDPQDAIPKGTLLAILITSSSYILFAIISGMCAVRDASGSAADYLAGNYTDCAFNRTCTYGLSNQDQMIELVAGYRWLVHAGNFAATLSSALACLVGAPRVFQALCRDDIYPYIKWFGKGYGHTDDPRRCYGLTFVIAVAFILIGNLNAIAPIMSNFFLAAFALINIAVAHAFWAKSPGFRPSFKYWNPLVSFLGFWVCLVMMFVLDWMTALITWGICILLTAYLYYDKPNVNWGSSTQAGTYKFALQMVQDLNRTEEHVKNYRPQLLVLSGKPMHRPQLVDFCNYITKGLGLMVCGHVAQPPLSERARSALIKSSQAWLIKRKCMAFYSVIEEESMEVGAKSLLQIAGIGKLRPNMVMLGYKNNWLVCDDSEVTSYFKILHDAFDRCMAVGILRMQDGLDYSYFMEDPTLARTDSTNNILGSSTTLSDVASTLHASQSTASLDTALALSTPAVPSTTAAIYDELNGTGPSKKKKKRKQSLAHLPKEVLGNIDYFRKKQKGTIDVWWLYDDGGLTMLVPYILNNRKDWSGCSLRVFALANSENQLDEDHRNMVSLLRKFRIEYEDVVIIADIQKPASEDTVKEFNELVSRFQEPYRKEGSELFLTQQDVVEHKERSNRYMRVREKLVEHSMQATLVVMTLPIPRKIGVPPALYMAWLETLTKQMPPFLLIRGNQTSVLTFYS